MAEKRIIIDRHHVIRQHRAFAVMVIVLLIAVLAVWFVQMKLMFRTVDFSAIKRSVAEAQELLDMTQDASADSTDDTQAGEEAPVDTADAEDAVRAEIAARAAATLTTPEAETTDSAMTQ